MAFSDLGRLGTVSIKKTGGSGPLANLTQIDLPAQVVQPFNPTNKTYLDAVNASQSTALVTAGNKTPAVAIRTYLKPSWSSSNFFKSLIEYIDATTGYTDTFAIRVNTQVTTRIYSLAKCTGISITHTKQGNQPGPIIVDLGFVAIYGDSEDPSPPTFATAAINTGQTVSACQVVWNSTADQVKSFQLQMSRVQAYQFSDNGTCYADEISSGAADGGLALVQSITNTISPGSTATIKLGATSSGIQIVLGVDLFNAFTPVDPGFVLYNAGYKLFTGSGGTPFAFTSF